MKEKCGVVGVYSFNRNNVMPMVMNSLKALQHRGQESWGVAAPNYPPFKKLGLVSEYHYDYVHILQSILSHIGIGHVRYSTIGTSDFRNVQPIQIKNEFLIAHNGTITNSYELEKVLGHEFNTPTWVSDTHLVGLRLLQLLRKNSYDWFKSFNILSKEVVGAYCFLILTSKGEIYAMRDDKGFRPLCIGEHKESNSLIITSESCALSILGAKLKRDVNPGEMIRINEDGITNYIFSEKERHAHCAFEYTYFAHPSSYLENRSIYLARKNVGKELAKRYRPNADIVIPVPDSARPAALGYYEESGIPFEEGLLKDRYGKKGGLRSFIQPTIDERYEITRMVLPLNEAVRGKKIVVVDDSIVRGTSSKQMVKYLKNAGAKEINLLSTFPPIIYPCYSGIDFPNKKDLVAYQEEKENQTINEININVSSIINSDFVGYNDIKGLCDGIGLSSKELCLSCVNGDYTCLKSTPKIDKRKLKK
jgi:amidophosphoribosyltransferase